MPTEHDRKIARLNGALATPDPGWIYAAQEDGTPLVKIGYTRFAPIKRLVGLRSQFGVSLTMISAMQVSAYICKVERMLHSLLAAEHIEREWFYLHMTHQRLVSLTQEAIDTLICYQQKALRYCEGQEAHAAAKKGIAPYRHRIPRTIILDILRFTA